MTLCKQCIAIERNQLLLYSMFYRHHHCSVGVIIIRFAGVYLQVVECCGCTFDSSSCHPPITYIVIIR